jgi:periplasmic protein TonB
VPIVTDGILIAAVQTFATTLGKPEFSGNSRRLSRESALAIAISAIAHASVAVAWIKPAMELPQVPAFNRVEVSLYSPPTPKTAQSAPKPIPQKAPSIDPIAADVPPAPADEKPSQDKDEPLVEARYNVETLHNPKPPYPLAARRRSQEGRVLISVFVRADGTCGEARLRKTSGFQLLDSSALQTVREWRFIPARRGDTAVETWVDVPVTFRLEDAA